MILYFADEIRNRTATQRFTDGKITFNRKSDHHQQHTNQKRNYNTSLVNAVQSIFSFIMVRPEPALTLYFKSIGITENETPDTIPGNNTKNRRKPGNSITGFFCLYRCCLY